MGKIAMAFDSILVITGMGVAPYSARGLTQTLTPIDASKALRRTINGALADVSYDQFRKYASKITCRDQATPAIDGIWPGAEVVVECVAELSRLTDTEGPQRPVVPGSEHVVGDFTFYRPVLFMRVTDYSNGLDEWNADYNWSLDLEEI